MVDKVIRIKIDSSGASRNIRNLDGEMRNLGQSADQTSQAFGKLKSVAQAVAGALATQQIIKYADAFTSIQNQIRQTVTSTEELTQRTGELLEVANRSRGEFGTVAELYTQLNLSTQELGLSSSELLRITETISKSFAVSGKSAAESAGAIRQLAQGLAAGALRGDEFNSVAEGAPEIMRALQRELKMNQGELREFAATGGITSKIIIDALGNAADVIDKKLNDSVTTFEQKITLANNKLTAFVGSSELMQGAVSEAGDAALFLAENLDTIANVALVAAIAGFGKLSAQVIMNTVETVKNTAAKIANANATTGLSAALGVQAQRMTAATIAMRTMTAAGTALRGVMAFLGGPLGLVITAASGIALFATNTNEATRELKDFNVEAEKAKTNFANITIKAEELRDRAKVADEIDRISNLLKRANADFARLERRLDQTRKKAEAGGNVDAGILGQMELQAQQAEQRIKDLEASLNRLRGRDPSSVVGDEPTTTGGDDSFVNTERFRTEALKNELAERLRLNQIFNESIVEMNATQAEFERAQAEANRQAALAMLERDKADMELRFQEEREAILANTRLTEEQKLILEAELEQQALTQKQIFEAEKVAIEAEAAERRKQIAHDEQMAKRAILAQGATELLGAIGEFGKKSVKLQKAVAIAQAAIAIQTGIARAQELGFPANLSEMARVIAVGARVKNAISGTDVGTANFGGGSVSSGGFSSEAAAPRQEVPQQTTAIEFRGLAEVAAELRNLDPNETLPVEYTQRIVASLAEFERLSGGGD